MSTTNNNGTSEFTSLASQQYLRPANYLGDAILHLTTTKSGDNFICEIYEKCPPREVIDPGTKLMREVIDLRPPTYPAAANFVSDRFKHGFRTLSRKNVYHPIFEIPITDYSISLIQKAWTNPKIISEMAKPLFNKIFLREFQAEQVAKRTAEYKLNGVVPTATWFEQHDKFLAEQEITLASYQKTAAYNSCTCKAYSLFCEPGTGKTAIMIRKLDHTISHSNRQTLILILCPKNIRQNWINEIHKFSMHGKRGDNNIFITQLQGLNSADREANFLTAISSEEAGSKHVVLISGYESFVQTEGIHKYEYDLCLLDESHNIANPSTKRTKTLLACRSHFNSVVIATGTPIRNTPFDTYTQMEFLGTGYSGFDSFAAFKAFYGIYTTPTAFQKIRHLEGFNNIPLLQEKLAKYSFIIKKEEALPHLPKKTFSIMECNLSVEQYKVYTSLAEQLYAEIENYGPNPDSITVNNILTQMLRLAQITSGFASIDAKTEDEKNSINRFDPNPKLELLIKLLLGDKEEEIDGILEDKNRKALVWCCFKENLKMIHSRLKLEGIESVMFHGSTDDKDDMVELFNRDANTRVFIGIAASGGVGLNLVGFDPNNPEAYTTNTTDSIIYSSNWSMVNRLQAIDRSHRYNTRVPQHITDLIVPRSIDQEILDRLQMKTDISMDMQDIKHVLRGLIPQYNGN